jgi:hypothetical protein
VDGDWTTRRNINKNRGYNHKKNRNGTPPQQITKDAPKKYLSKRDGKRLTVLMMISSHSEIQKRTDCSRLR